MSEKLVIAICAAVGISVAIGIWWISTPGETDDTGTSKKPPTVISVKTKTSTPSPIVDNQQKTSTPIPKKRANKIDVVTIEKCVPTIAFMVCEQGSNPKNFLSIDSAMDALRGAKSDATLSLTFEKCAISSIDEELFRRFVARVGDYIFVQRMLFIEDMGEVLSEPNFGRVTEDEVERRGNVLLSRVDEKHLSLEIRGLTKQVDQVEIVARDLLIKAITSPAMIIDQPACKAALLSERLAEHLSIKISQNIAVLINALQDSAVFEEEIFKPFDVESNLSAFIPSVEFRGLNSLSAMQVESLKQQYAQFYSELDKRIIQSLDTNATCDEEQFTNLTRDHYAWLVLRVKKWAQDTDIASIIKNSILSQ